MDLNFKDENWFFQYWRPAIAWAYLIVCMFDFLITPYLLGFYCWATHVPIIMWDPLTLKGGAIFHASMGAICGVTSWSRGREKIAVIQGNGGDDDDDHHDHDHDAVPTQLLANTVADAPPAPPIIRRQGDDC